MFTLTDYQRSRLMANGRTDFSGDHVPVVRLIFTGGPHTWLLSALDPEAPRIAWCIADINHGCVEAGTVDLLELQSLALGSLEVRIHPTFDAKGHRLYEFHRAAQSTSSLPDGIRKVLGDQNGGGDA